MRRELDEAGVLTASRPPDEAAGTTLGPIALPLHPQSIEMANAQRYPSLTLGHLVEHDAAGTPGVFVEELPQQGDLQNAELCARCKRWTSILTGGRLAQGEGHDVSLLKRSVQDEVCTFALNGQGPFLSKRKSMSLSQKLNIVLEVRRSPEIFNFQFSTHVQGLYKD
jgi:hypothetical protein